MHMLFQIYETEFQRKILKGTFLGNRAVECVVLVDSAKCPSFSTLASTQWVCLFHRVLPGFWISALSKENYLRAISIHTRVRGRNLSLL